MWTTTFKHSINGVSQMTHDFGNDVRVVTDFSQKTMRLLYGDIIKKEYPLETCIEHYVQFLQNVYAGLHTTNKTI